MAEKRISKRVAFRNIVKFGTTMERTHTAFITDLSDTGICIKTTSVYKPGTLIYLAVDVSDDKVCEATGVVAWAKAAPAHLARFVKSGMGIRFTEVDPALIGFYEDRI